MIKTLKYFTPVICLFILNNNLFSKTKNIIQYYNSIPKKFFKKNNIYKYKIKYKNRKWITRSIADYKIKIKTVDIKNGYFKIIDQGARVQQCALFRNKKAQYFLIITETIFGDTPITTKQKIKVFTFKQNRAKDVTKKVIPKVMYMGFFNFVTKKYLMQKNVQSLIKVYYKLPRYGTKMKICLDQRVFSFVKSEVPDEKLIPIVKYLEKRLHTTCLDLFWDKRLSIFHY